MASINLVESIVLDDLATNDSTSTVAEPSVAAHDDGIFVTGNWFASRSADAGSTWDHVDPFTTLPSAAGGFCCDQLTLHDSERGVWIWILQYISVDGANVFRLAACADADFASGGWYWWDVAPTTLDASWTNEWFDYPDAAISDSALYISFNHFDAADQWQRATVMRFPLSTIADRGTLSFDFWHTTENGSLRLTQGAGDTMYWGSHNSDDVVRLFSWQDGQNGVNWWDIAVRAYSTTISSTSPAGVDWLSRTDTRITGAAVGEGLITFMWTAGEDEERPHAYCRAVRIDATTKHLVDEPDVWSSARSWAYPAISPDVSGIVGLTAFHGGVDRDVGLVVGAFDSASGSWVTAYAQQGDHSPSAGTWGDYLTCRPAPGNANGWVAVGYTLEGGDTRHEISPMVVTFELTDT